jgi:hypothetical protein
MNVAELQQFLRGLAQPLSTGGAAKVAGELERVCIGLEPFRDLGLGQFADFLQKAESYQRDGTLSVGARPGRGITALDHDKVKAAAQRIQHLYEQAADPNIPYTAIDAEIKKLDKLLNKDEAAALAREVGIPNAVKTKKAALDEIKRKITIRKESFQRTQFRA